MVKPSNLSWNVDTLVGNDSVYSPIHSPQPIPRAPSNGGSVNGNDFYSTDENSEVDVDIQAKQVRARERVGILRARVARTRRMIQDRRGDVRQLREGTREASSQLMRTVDEMGVLGGIPDLERVAKYHQNLRSAMDRLGPAEDEYDMLERRLSDEEQELEEEEDHFYRHNVVSSPNLPDLKIDMVLSPLIKPYEPPDSEFQELSLTNEQMRDYLEKIKIAEKLKSDLEKLESDHGELAVESTFRRSNGIALSSDAEAFLAAFPERYRETHDRLLSVEEILFVLRDQCLEQGLFTESEYSYEAHDTFSEELLDLVHETRDRSPLSGARERAAYSNKSSSSKDRSFIDKRTYVNKWLLEWVQDSVVQELQLRAWIYFECRGADREEIDRQWPELAVQMWQEDDAGENANEGYALSKMDAIYGGTKPTRSSFFDSLASVAVDFGDVGAVEEIIMGSETGSYATQKEHSEPTPTTEDRRSSI